MKNILKFSLMLVIVLTGINVKASEVNFYLNVKKEEGKKIAFELNDINKADLSIYDAAHNLIHSEKVNSSNNISRTYDLKNLPDGNYFLEAESEMKIVKYNISIIGEKAILGTSAVSAIYKPVFENKKGIVALNILNFDKSPVNIKIYDEENVEVYDSAILTEQNVNKFFDLNRDSNQEYTFVVKYDDKTFTKTF